jgi:hypothetical protein
VGLSGGPIAGDSEHDRKQLAPNFGRPCVLQRDASSALLISHLLDWLVQKINSVNATYLEINVIPRTMFDP